MELDLDGYPELLPIEEAATDLRVSWNLGYNEQLSTKPCELHPANNN